ncbi:MAG: divalent-cation tolerance protein CutA [candidate division Zixibacteria bacterium]|nr:divalent-cation tolerance protein CutA [candidate division Zixibacteria bacterium]
METIRVVFISVPRDEASKLARKLVEERLAACVNVVPKIESYFWWDDAVQHDQESLLIAKTTDDKFDDLADFVVENHSFELPEIIAFELAGGLTEYIAWIHRETE